MGKVGDEIGRHGGNVGAARQELKYSEAAVELTLALSRVGVAVMAAMAVATLALIFLTPGPCALRIVAATWIACAALESIHAAALHRGRRGIRAIHVIRAGEISVRDDGGAWQAGVLRDGSFVAPWLTIIRWRAQGGRFDRTLVILPDMVPAEDFRRLRVMLRWA